MNLDSLLVYSPSERKSHWPDDSQQSRQLYRTRKFVTVWAAIYFLPLVCSVLNYFPKHSIADCLVPLFISTGGSLGLAASILQGYVALNHGIYFRKKEPIRYWLWNVLPALLTLLPVFILILK